MAAIFLETYVVPVCVWESRNGIPYIVTTVGTAFLINDGGLFLTARHVLEQAERLIAGSQRMIAMVGKSDGGNSPASVLLNFLAIEHAPAPYDVSMVKTGYRAPTVLRLREFTANMWRDVASYGYPVAAHGGTPGNLRLNIRGFKGYIQRETVPEDMHIGTHPNGFELSFNISPGMSGAPVFLHGGEVDTVIGIAVSSFRGETTEAEISEVDDRGQKFTERRLRIEEFGFAHDIRGILDWRPSIAGGATLAELSIKD